LSLHHILKPPGTNQKSVDERLFRLLVANVKDYAIFMLDPQGYIITWNKGAEHIKGYSENEIIGKHIAVFYTEADNEKKEPQHNLAEAQKEGSYESEGWRVRKNGDVFWANVVFTALYDDDEKLLGFSKITRDITEQKKAEEQKEEISIELEKKVRENAQELFAYKYALDESAIVAITDQKGIIKHVNENFCRISKYNEHELIGKDHRIINSSYHSKAFIANIWHTIANGKIWKGELKNKAKDGSYYWVDTTIVPFLNEQGKPYQYIAIRSDITEKKELEELLKRATTLARIGGWEVDLIKNTVYWSDITRDIYEVDAGFEPDMKSGINFFKEGEDRETFGKVIDEAVNTGASNDIELQIVTAKGKVKWVRIIVEAEFVQGRCLRIYGSFQDIDVRKKAEIESVQALGERNTILESIDDAFFAVDKNWIVTYWNKMAETVLLTPKETILHHNLWDVFSGSVGSESYKKYHEAVETGQAAHFEDYYPVLEKWYEISAYPASTGLSVYFKDKTERKASEIRLKELNANLEKHIKELAISNAELEQFAYVASHDLQEPLRMITSFLTQLERKYGNVVDDKGKQYIHFAVDGAKRMRQIILDLLDFSRVGRMEDDLEEVDFNKLVNEILVLYRKPIEELQAIINIDNLPVMPTYKTPVRQVFQNLISNSLKYHNKNGPPVITISCRETKTQYQFGVKDNGIGISSDYFDKIFIIFQRLHNKDEYSGTGMGLAIAKKIIENLGGKIWVESRESEGATFYFTLKK